MYDIFYVSPGRAIADDYQQLRSKYPNIQKLEYISSFEEIKSKSFTKMFWVIWSDVKLDKDFDLNSYRATEWDDMYIHVFKNADRYEGICLFPKSISVSSKEYQNRFFVNKKEIDIIASYPRRYDQFSIINYEDYQHALKDSATDLFWGVWNTVEIIDESVLDLYFDYGNTYDRRENHAFKNICGEKQSYLNGIILFSKSKEVSNREISRKYLIDKKEHDIIASTNRYKRYVIDTYERYQEILEKETQPMFWCLWDNIEIIDESVFNIYFDPNDGKYDHDRRENHMFKNLCQDTESYLNGLTLFSVSKPISKKEFSRRYLIDKKEHDHVVSRNRYKRYVIENYEEYLNIIENETQTLFWAIWPELEIIDNSVFDIYFDPNDGRYDHDRSENHVFQNLFKGEQTFVNGVCLFSKKKVIGKKEFDHRFLVEKKEWPRPCSRLKPYDIVFISYNEPNADENFELLQLRFPRAKRIHGVSGIHQAHIKAAELSSTDMFFVVDGDAIIVSDFNFDYEASVYERGTVHVWRSQNPVNDLEYGYGGVKLLPRTLTLSLDTKSYDMTTSISKKLKVHKEVSNITAFNVDEFSTWRSAFRECAKLASQTMRGQISEETEQRLAVWCSYTAKDRPYAAYAIKGAILGKEHGSKNKNKPRELALINDFDWLNRKFKEYNI